MPVSMTSNLSRATPLLAPARPTSIRTPPEPVNLTALPARLSSTWRCRQRLLGELGFRHVAADRLDLAQAAAGVADGVVLPGDPAHPLHGADTLVVAHAIGRPVELAPPLRLVGLGRARRDRRMERLA